MKAITLQGTKEQLQKLNTFLFNNGSNERLPKEVETRVYLLEASGTGLELELTDEEFMIEAEKRGTVYSLNGFQVAVNYSEDYIDESYIRFISVPI